MKLGLKNGEMLHVANQGTQMTNLPPPPKKFVPLEEPKKEDASMKEEQAPLKDSFGRVLKAPEEKKEEVKTDSFGRVIKEAEK